MTDHVKKLAGMARSAPLPAGPVRPEMFGPKAVLLLFDGFGRVHQITNITVLSGDMHDVNPAREQVLALLDAFGVSDIVWPKDVRDERG